MFATSKRLNDAVKALMKFTKDFKRGQLLRFSMMEKAVGCKRYTDIWTTIVQKYKAVLLEQRGIVLFSVRKVGYKFTSLDEHLIENPVRRQRKSIKQLSHAVKETEALNPIQLTAHKQHLRAVTLQHLVDERRLVKRGIRKQNVIRKSKTLPKNTEVA